MSKNKSKLKNTVDPNNIAVKPGKETKTTVDNKINLSTIESNEKIQQTGSNTSFSADSATRLGCLLQERYVNGNNMGKKYPSEFLNVMNEYVDVCAITAIVLATEEAKARGGSLKLLFPEEKMPLLVEAANSIGIKLPLGKLIESTTNKEGKQLEIDFTKAEVPTNILDAAKKEVASRVSNSKTELDASKIVSIDQLHESASAILSDSSRGSFAKRITDAVDLYQKYYIKAAGTDAKKISEISDKPINEWLEELINTTNSSTMMKCLGTGMYTSVATTHCPIGAFLLLRRNLMDTNHKTAWTDESIVLAVKCLVEMAAKDRMKTMIDANGQPKPNAITRLEDDTNLVYLTNFEESIINRIMDPEERKNDSFVKQIFGLTLANYFIDKSSRKVDGSMNDMIANKIGAIANMFRPFDGKFSNYPSSTEEKEYPIATKKDEINEKESTPKDDSGKTNADDTAGKDVAKNTTGPKSKVSTESKPETKKVVDNKDSKKK